MGRALVRIVAQLLVSGPVIFFYPFLAFATGHTLYDLFVRPQAIGAFSAIFVAGGLGLTGLYASILLPIAWLRGKRWVKWTVTALMALGILLAVVFVAIGGDAGKPMEDLAWMAWTYGGPLVVAIWNLWRMHAPPGRAWYSAAPPQEPPR